jgi:uncharacterized delta-60 repeat protein
MARRLELSLALALAIAAGTLLPASPVLAAPGDLDPSFGEGGRAVLALGYATVMVGQPDGGIVYATPGRLYDGRFELHRTTPAGKGDATYGGDGSPDVKFPGQGAGIRALGSGPDGAITAVGTTDGRYPDEQGAIARFKADGTPDQGFGAGGVQTIDLGAGESLIGVAVAPDGSAVAVGVSHTNSGGDSTSFVARFRPDGTLDPSFAGVGYELEPDRVTGGDDTAQSVAILPDGRIEILLLTEVGNDPFPRHPRVVMLKPDGDLDPSFAGDGVAELDLSLGSATGIARTRSGETYVFGSGVADVPTEHVARLTSTGQPDPTFAGGGSTTLPLGAFAGGAVDGSDRLVLAGSSFTGGPAYPTETTDVELWRLGPDGSPDLSFGGDGTVQTDVGGYGSPDAPEAMIVDAAGRPVITSEYGRGSKLLRYLADAGPADADADLILDGADSCPNGFAPDVADGCPTWRVVGLTFGYARRVDDFVGSVNFDSAQTCSDGAIVSVFRLRPGRDRLIGRSDPAIQGADLYDEEPDYRWSVSALAPTGRYYARVRPRLISDFGHCGTYKTRPVRIRSRQSSRVQH